MFHQIMTDGGSWMFSRHMVTIHDAVADGLPRNVEELRRAAGSAETWAQEYECQFLDTTASAWLPFELIAACQTAQAGQPEGYTGGPCYVGMDIAARGDLTVIAVLEAVGDVLVTRELLALRATFAAQLAELDRIMRQYRVVRAAIDQTGMGEMPVEEARRRHGSYRVEGVLFTASRKLDLAVALKTRMEDRRIRIPEGQAIVDDLRSVRAEVGVAGLPRLVAERQAGSHADRFWALALACAAAEDEAPAYDGYRALPRTPDVDDDEAARFGGRRMF
jgi:phage FluMu gp28-like protein